ncbi:hypothetical protein, partial [Jeotgalibaca porci]|uniref:hypothetical protein n=1 Tax=Jeotgalibaca porci TaxID=1868793 RepID=UPI0035A0B132
KSEDLCTKNSKKVQGLVKNDQLLHYLPRKRAKVSLNQLTFARRATLTQTLHFCRVEEAFDSSIRRYE